MFSWINSTTVYSRDPIFYHLEGSEGSEFTKPEASATHDPYVVMRSLHYENGGASRSLAAWNTLLPIYKKDNGTLMFGVYTYPDDLNMLFTVEAYVDKTAWTEHTKSQDAMENGQSSKDVKTAEEFTFLEMKGGFLYRDKT
jgi:quinol monooxygenase YgiN